MNQLFFLWAWYKIGDANISSYNVTASITTQNTVSIQNAVVVIDWGSPAQLNPTDENGVTKVFNNAGQVITPVTQPANNTKFSTLAPTFKLFPAVDGNSIAYGETGYAGEEITGDAAKQYAGDYKVRYAVTGAAKISDTNPDSTAGGAFESTAVFSGTTVNATLTVSSSTGGVSISPATIYYAISGSDDNFANPGNESGTVKIEAFNW